MGSSGLRYAPDGTNFSLSVSIYDTGKIGFLRSKKEGFGILIESRELEQLLRVLFESFWAASTPTEKSLE